MGLRRLLNTRRKSQLPTQRKLFVRNEGMMERANKKTLISKFPKYMRKDAEKASRNLGIKFNYRPKASFGKSAFHGKYHTVMFGGGNSRKFGKASPKVLLSALRHEIGHAQIRKSPRDMKRLMREHMRPLPKVSEKMRHRMINKRTRRVKQRDEMLAWKNAIRASKNANVHWPTVGRALSTYHTRRTKSPSGKVLLPSYKRSIKTLMRYQRFVRHVRRKK